MSAPSKPLAFLKAFKVEGFKQFKSLSLDFSDIRDYAFCMDCLTKSRSPRLIKTALIYGPNASGKSNLGFAIFDIVQHLTDKISQPDAYEYYLNADQPETPAKFEYTFILNKKEVRYCYAKTNSKKLVSEQLFIDGQEAFSWAQDDPNPRLDGLKKFGVGPLNLIYKDSSISYLRYIANNSALDDKSPIRMLMNFVSSMLWFRRVDKNNNFMGLRAASDQIDQFIIKQDLVKEFESFLNANQVQEKLAIAASPDGKTGLYFKHHRLLPFFDVASSGTIALAVYFYWLHSIAETSFLFMDEFDAFYHFAIAQAILQQAKKFKCQTILTTHNTGLLKHSLIRPDACFLIKNGELKSFPNLTDREIREGNNLEKLFITGEFDA